MKGFTETITYHVIGFRHVGRFDEYATLVKRAFDDLRSRIGDIPGQTGRTVAIYEPIKGKEHVEGFFYVGYIVEAEPSSSATDGWQRVCATVGDLCVCNRHH
jgi:hypothetical protein